jgi:hypothetical protein
MASLAIQVFGGTGYIGRQAWPNIIAIFALHRFTTVPMASRHSTGSGGSGRLNRIESGC